MNEDLDRIDRMVRSVVAVEPSPQFENRIRSRIRQDALRQRQSSGRTALMAGIAASVLVAFLLIGLRRPEPIRTAEQSPSMPSAIPAAVTSSDSAPVTLKKLSNEEVKAPIVPLYAPLEKAAESQQLAPSPLKEFSLEKSSEPLTALVLPSSSGLPQFEIQAFALPALSEGVAQ